MSRETRELTLRKGRFDKSVIYRVKKHWSVIFKLAPEFLEDETLSIFINYPEDGSQFDRDKYQDIFKVKNRRRNNVKITPSLSGQEDCDGTEVFHSWLFPLFRQSRCQH